MSQARLTKWVAGFFDGEGSLGASIKKNDNSRIGFGVTPYAEIQQAYVGGLFDAEGCVQCTVSEDDRAAVGWSPSPSVKITMSPKENLIKQLEKFANSIDAEASVNHYQREPDNWNDVFNWQIGGVESIEAFCKQIRGDVIVKREQVDIMLDEIIPLLRSGHHTHRRGFLRLIALRDVMNAHKGGTRGKYNLEYFEDLWGMTLEPGRLPDAHPKKKGTPMGGPP